MGVGIWAWALATPLYAQSALPVDAFTPINPRPENCTYWRIPQALLITGEDEPARSRPSGPTSSGYAAVHRSLPVLRSKAASAASFAPGVQITFSPSTRTDSA